MTIAPTSIIQSCKRRGNFNLSSCWCVDYQGIAQLLTAFGRYVYLKTKQYTRSLAGIFDKSEK